MKIFTFLVLVGTITLSLGAQQAMSQPPDTSVCEGLTGAAWGLCRGGVAAGCVDGTGNPSACGNIEETFQKVTGLIPPWVIPPVTCPCDYGLVPKTAPPWEVTISSGIQFACFSTSNSVGFLSDPATGVLLGANIGVVDNESQNGCAINVDMSPDEDLRIAIGPLTPEELLVCRQDVITYAQEFMLLNPDILVDDTCSPNL